MFILALLGLLGPGRSALASPPEKASVRVVLDEVRALRATVQRLALAPSDPAQAEGLAAARARLAEAEGRLRVAEGARLAQRQDG
jgi:hypothetical protein